MHNQTLSVGQTLPVSGRFFTTPRISQKNYFANVGSKILFSAFQLSDFYYFIVMEFSSSEIGNWQRNELSSQLSLPSANNVTKISHTYCLITIIICCRSFFDKFTSEEVNSIKVNLLLLSTRSCSFYLAKTALCTASARNSDERDWCYLRSAPF